MNECMNLINCRVLFLQIRFFVVEKSSGNVLPGKFFAPTGMVLHHINAYEDKGIIYGTVYTIDCMTEI